jgi:DNA polymerase-1
MEEKKRLFLLDAYALIYRSYYAFIKNPRINSKGENTSAIFGFINTLEDILKREKPTHIAVCFDPPGPTFRHEAFEQYKAQRDETPEVIRWSVPYIKNIIKAYRIPVLEVMGFEADDVIGTVSRRAEEKGFEVFMMTPDKDCGQLVTEKVFMYRPKYGGNEFEVLGIEEVKQKYSINSPSQIIDLLGLMGDSSDNIPGCPGVGEVTAKKLLAEFGSIDNLLENTDKLKGSLKDKVTGNVDMIRFSKFLATIKTDVPVDFDEEKLIMETPDVDELKSIFQELEFRNLLGKLDQSNSTSTPIQNSKENTVSQKTKIKETPKVNVDPNQFSLWDSFGNPNEENVSNGKFDNEKINNQTSTENPEESSENGDNSGFENEIFAGNRPEENKFSNLRSLNDTEHSYYLIDNETKFLDFLEKIKSMDFFCLDTETTSVDALDSKLVGMSFSWEKNVAYYIPFDEDEISSERKISQLKPILENENILIIGQNIKYDIIVLKNYGVSIKAKLFDTMIAHYLLQPDLRHNMDFLAEIYLGYKTIHIEELIGPKGKNQKNMKDVPHDIICPYAAEDADITLQLKYILEKEISDNGLEYLAYEVEMPLIKVLADMEYNGVRIDTVSLSKSTVEISHELERLEKEIQEFAGFEFNVNSPKQLGEILFEKLEVDGKPKKTKSGQYSTSEETLTKLKSKHPVIDKILTQRGLKKLLNTYIEALPELINPKTGNIHTSFNQAITSTGRLSSSNPNLQNIPVRDEMGREIRKAFIAGENEYFFSADYSQIELRLMAHLSHDPYMIEAFTKDQDIHAATAAKIYKVPIEEVTSDMRRKAKTANFGIIYGISVFGLSERMNIPRAESKELIDGYFNTYPNVRKYMDNVVQEAKSNGWVETIFHRKRNLADINSQNAVVRGYAERNAINAPIQGTAADIIKIAMVRIHKALIDNKLKTKMILQVHDELDFIVPKEELEIVSDLVKKEMESAVSLSVPLKADTGYGNNWLEAH